MKRLVKYTIKNANDIYATYYPEPSFLVPGLIPLKGLTILAGPYKGGKSWFLLFLGITLSRSGMFLGTIALETHKGLYLALEDSDARLHHRMHCLGFEPGDNFLICTSFPSGVDGLNALTKLLSEDRTIEYVIIDTLGRFSSGRGKGGYQEDYDWVGSIKNIADDYGIAIVVVTHTRKLVDDHDEFNDIHGSCGTMAVADSILKLKKSRHSGNGTLACTGRDFEEKKYEVFFSKDSCCWTIKGESNEVASTPERQAILEVLKERGEMTPQEISTYISRTPKAVSNTLAKLREEGLVDKGSKYGTWIKHQLSIPITSSTSSLSPQELARRINDIQGAMI